MPELPAIAPNRREFWDRHPGLVWSNRDAPDDVFIAAALRKGRFLQLLEIAVEFGLDRVRRVWETELSCGDLSDRLVARVNDHLRIFDEAQARVAASRHESALS